MWSNSPFALFPLVEVSTDVSEQGIVTNRTKRSLANQQNSRRCIQRDSVLNQPILAAILRRLLRCTKEGAF
jgi:hypothetical protein